ncbi:MAG: hypothetical protein ACREHD_16310, partial [Pirellulales bacterium]
LSRSERRQSMVVYLPQAALVNASDPRALAGCLNSVARDHFLHQLLDLSGVRAVRVEHRAMSTIWNGRSPFNHDYNVPLALTTRN